MKKHRISLILGIVALFVVGITVIYLLRSAGAPVANDWQGSWVLSKPDFQSKLTIHSIAKDDMVFDLDYGNGSDSTLLTYTKDAHSRVVATKNKVTLTTYLDSGKESAVTTLKLDSKDHTIELFEDTCPTVASSEAWTPDSCAIPVYNGTYHYESK